MNILELKEALVKTTKIFSGKNIPVYTEGFQPRIEYDTRTKEPVAVYIPNIPADAPPKLIAAIHGFIDHECAHAKLSDSADICDDSKNKLWHYIHNCIEDVRINKAMGKMYPGSKKNIKLGYEYLFKMEGPKGEPSGYSREGIDKVPFGTDEEKADFWMRYAPLFFAGAMDCEINRDKYHELGIGFRYKEMMDKADPTFMHKLKSVKTPEDVSALSDYFTDFFSEEALEKLMPTPSKGAGPKGKPSAGAVDKAMEEYKDMEDRVSEAIHKEIERCVIDDKEMIYWTDRFDKKYNKHDIVREVAGRTRHDAIDVTRFEEETKQVSNYLMKDLRRLLEERRRRYYVGGYKSGKLNARTLWSVKVGNDRIFKKKNEIRDVNAAVSLLIDLSGSMSGTKVHVAMQSAYAFAMVLQQLKIPYEVYGFTTENTDYGMQAAYDKFADGKDKKALDRIVNQNCPERIYAFKEFHEGFDIYSKQAMTGAGGSRVNLIQNEDSKHVMLALQRLSARPERVKSLFVFSDGVPAYCSRNPRASYDNLKYYGHNAKSKYGVDVYSIGIQSNSVQNFYKDYKVVQNIQELPNALFEFLRKAI